MPTVKINGMSCQHCAASVTNALNKIDGITDVKVDLENKEATYTDNKSVALEKIKEAISKIGFEVP